MIIGITGRAHSGKDTAADIMIDEYGFIKESLAAPLKRMVQDIFCLNPDVLHDPVLKEMPIPHLLSTNAPSGKPWTTRSLLQFIGTELFRNNIDDGLWVKSLCWRIQPDRHYVVPDVRFPNETDYLRQKFGKQYMLVTITRDGCDGKTDGGIVGHASELHNLEGDVLIQNNEDVTALHQNVRRLMEFLSIDPIIIKRH